MTDPIARVDHLVYGVADLERGIAEVEQRLGVRAVPGGRHPGKGTRNALLSLGPRVYLEIIAPDPEQPTPEGPRTFGIDALTSARLLTWAANAQQLERTREEAGRAGITLGEVFPASRQRPDGVLLSWRYTDPRVLVADGVVPFLIDWGGSPHPAESAPGGATLISLRAEHPDAARVRRMLDLLDLQIDVTHAERPALIATLDSPRGRGELQ